MSFDTWLIALLSSSLMGFTSLVPWLFNLTFFEHRKTKSSSHGKFDQVLELPSNASFNVWDGALRAYHLKPPNNDSK